MKFRFLYVSLLFISAALFLNDVQHHEVVVSGEVLKFPYASKGLTKRQAAAHLVSRFTYGAKPGQVDEVVKIGLEKWFQLQLDQKFNDDSLAQMLNSFQFLNLTNEEAFYMFPRPSQILKRAITDGVIPKDSLKSLDRDQSRLILKDYVKDHNIHQQSELVREFINQRILRAVYSNNQLQEVMVGFWFNHFNVSMTKNTCIVLMPAYERDVIRKNTLGSFGDLLLATAKSPAMLVYLDNFISVGDNDSLQFPESKKRLVKLMEQYQNADDSSRWVLMNKIKKAQNSKGLNENYARELMELHTLGVDGGYTQNDVTQAARVLTGWGLYPIEESYAPAVKRLLDEVGEEKLKERGFVHDGDFMFAMNRHDVKPKLVLGEVFNSDMGYSEGIRLLDLLSRHPSTANFICKKLATYFVCDNPPKSLIDKMSNTFLHTDGNIKSVLVTLVNSPEFWSKESVRQKIKSPFELAVSAVRALDAEIEAPYPLFGRVDKMGQKIYYYQAPTGFPDRADYWINSGSLLQRMNFGIDIANANIKGISLDLLRLNDNHEPENTVDALRIYSALLMPERDVSMTVKRLTPLLNESDLKSSIDMALHKDKKRIQEKETLSEEEKDDMDIKMKKYKSGMLAQVVGLIIGSPEFQRR